MKASHILSCRAENGVAVIRMDTATSGSMMFIGASCTASTPAFTYGVQDVTITPSREESGVVALRVTRETFTGKGIGVHRDEFNFLIPFTWGNGRLVVDLEQPFLGTPDRLGQLVGDGDLTVMTDGQRFTTCRNPWVQLDYPAFLEKKEKMVSQGCRIVEDPNLICEFLAGKKDLADLVAAASLDRREFIVQQLERTRCALAAEMDKVAWLAEELKKKESERSEWEREAVKLLRERNQAQTAYADTLVRGAALKRQCDDILNGVWDILHNQGVYHRTIFGWTWWMKLRKLRSYIVRQSKEAM